MWTWQNEGISRQGRMQYCWQSKQFKQNTVWIWKMEPLNMSRLKRDVKWSQVELMIHHDGVSNRCLSRNVEIVQHIQLPKCHTSHKYIQR